MYIAVPDSLGGMGGLKATDVRKDRTPFMSVQDWKSDLKCPYALHPVSLRSFPNVAFETLPMFV